MNHLLRTLLSVVLLPLAIMACASDDPVRVGGGDVQDRVVVLNSTALTLTVVSLDGGGTRRIELGPEGTPASMAVHEGTAVVPLGVYPAVAVADLRTGTVTTIPLPAGSGATGAIIVDDTLALIANSDRNTISPLLYDRDELLPEISVGLYPQGFAAAGDEVFVINARLDESFQPIGPGTLTVLNAMTLGVIDTIQLSGTNSAEAIADAGSLWVLNRGRFGAADGSLSKVSLGTLSEVAHHAGFGELPGALARRADGALLIGSFSYGIAVWSPASQEFLIAPGDAVRPAPAAVVSDVAVDARGDVYSLDAGDCTAPGSLYVLDDDLQATRSITVGACPLVIRFSRF